MLTILPYFQHSTLLNPPVIDLDDGSWLQVAIPVSRLPGGFTSRGFYVMRDFKKKAVYDVVVRAQNEFGMSKLSQIFNFYNKNTGEKELNKHSQGDPTPQKARPSISNIVCLY